MKKLSCFLASIILLPTIATATPLNPNHYPDVLKYKNQPIDPLCFYSQESTNTINLKDCGVTAQKYTIMSKNENNTLVARNFYGFEWQDTTPSYPSKGMSYYQAWQDGSDNYWIYTINNTGGSGDFTSLNLFSRKDDHTVSLQSIADGDRCNGGINKVIQDDNRIKYSTNLTAFDFLILANANPHHLKPYDDLASCASCCAAEAYFTVDNTLKPKLLYVSLDKDTQQLSDQGSANVCFNQLVTDYVKEGKTKLDPTELKMFVQNFNDKCAKKNIH